MSATAPAPHHAFPPCPVCDGGGHVDVRGRPIPMDACGVCCERCGGSGRVDPDTPRRRLILDPELTDGCHWVPADSADQVTESLQLWMDEAEPGDEITIKLRMMSDREVEELPDI